MISQLVYLVLTPAGCAAQCTRFIYGYMAFAGFSIFFTLTGLIALQLVVRFGVVLDAVSFAFILYNFAVRPCLSPQVCGVVWLAPGSSKESGRCLPALLWCGRPLLRASVRLQQAN